MNLKRHNPLLVALVGALLCTAMSTAAAAQSSDGSGVPSLVEVYWQGSRSVVAPPLSNIVVLDQEIARVDSVGDGLQIFGLERGETVVLGYLHDKPVSIRVRVIPRPIIS